MKKQNNHTATIFLFLALIFAFTNCNQNRESQELNIDEIIADTTTIYVFYFRINRRCENCDAVGDVARNVVETKFADNDNVRFLEIQNSVRANLPLLEKFDVAWNALIIAKGDDYVDITQRAFLNVLRNPQMVESRIAEEINRLRERR
jgi:hypothetical protein